MIKIMFAARAKPGLTRAQALHHLRHNHAAVVSASHTHRTRSKTYIQNHALDGLQTVPAITLDRDWIIENWRDERVVLPEPPVAPDAILVREDEARFPDRATLLTLQVEEEPVWQAEPDAPFASAPVKVFTYFRRPASVSEADFQAARRKAAERLAALPAFRREARSFIHNRAVPGQGAPVHATASPSAEKVPPYQGVDIIRFPDLAAVTRLFEDPDFRQALADYEAAVMSPDGLFRLVTEENLVFDDAKVDPASRA
jgi:hypothetical protein